MMKKSYNTVVSRRERSIPFMKRSRRQEMLQVLREVKQMRKANDLKGLKVIKTKMKELNKKKSRRANVIQVITNAVRGNIDGSSVSDDRFNLLTFSEKPFHWMSQEQVFVRESYVDFVSNIFPTLNKIVVIGNPGIGKTYLVLYLFYVIFTSQSWRVIVYSRDGYYYCFLLDSMRVIITKDKTSSEFRQVILPLLDETTTLYVFDCFKSKKPDFCSLPSKFVVLTSPRRDNYHDVIKEGGVPYYFHPWSRDEISALSTLNTVSPQDVQARWELFGGIPRYVFASQNYNYYSSRRDDEIAKFSIDSLCLAFQRRKKESDSLIIFHEYSCGDIRFASKVTKQAVFTSIKSKSAKSFAEFLKSGFEASFNPALLGYLYEYCSQELLVSGEKFKIRKMVQGSRSLQSTSSLKLEGYTRFEYGSLDEINFNAVPIKRYYYVPRNVQENTYDAFVQVDTRKLKVFQITRQSCHQIEGDGLVRLESKFESLTVEFFFVVPKHIYSQYYLTPKTPKQQLTKVTLEKCYSVPLRNSGVSDVKVRSDSKIFASGGWDGRNRVFGWKKGKPLAALNYHTAAVQSISFSASHEHSNLLICGSKDQRVSLWKLY